MLQYLKGKFPEESCLNVETRHGHHVLPTWQSVIFFRGGVWSNRCETYLITSRLFGHFGLLLSKLATTYSCRLSDTRLMACLTGQGSASVLEDMRLKVNKWLRYTNCLCCLTPCVNEIILEVTCVFFFNFLCPELLLNWFKGNFDENSRKKCNCKAGYVFRLNPTSNAALVNLISHFLPILKNFWNTYISNKSQPKSSDYIPKSKLARSQSKYV